MNKKQFTKLEESLTKRGYRKFDDCNHFKSEDYYLYKPFHKEDNRWEEDRSAMQILLYVYVFTDFSPKMRDRVDIMIHIDVSRTIDERIGMTLAWHDDTTIEEIEKLAESFYSWVVCMMAQPRKEE